MFKPESRDSPNIALITIVSGWVFTAVAIIALALVFWSRRIQWNGHIGIDDYLLLAAFITSFVLIVLTTWAILDEDQAKHIEQELPSRLAMLGRSLLANEALWGLVNTLVRLSASLSVWKIFGNMNMRRVTIGLLVVSMIFGLATVLDVCLICHPIAAAWDSSVPGTCGNQTLSYVILEVCGLLIDLAILVASYKVISQLQMNPRKKIEVALFFSAGIFIFIITGLRIQALHMETSADFTYAKSYTGLLSILGALLSIIVCCAAAIRMALIRLWTIMLSHRVKKADGNRKDEDLEVLAEKSASNDDSVTRTRVVPYVDTVRRHRVAPRRQSLIDPETIMSPELNIGRDADIATGKVQPTTPANQNPYFPLPLPLYRSQSQQLVHFHTRQVNRSQKMTEGDTNESLVKEKPISKPAPCYQPKFSLTEPWPEGLNPRENLWFLPEVQDDDWSVSTLQAATSNPSPVPVDSQRPQAQRINTGRSIRRKPLPAKTPPPPPRADSLACADIPDIGIAV